MIDAIRLLRQFIEHIFDVVKRRQSVGFGGSTRLYKTALASAPLLVFASIQFLRLCRALHKRKNWPYEMDAQPL